jgi:peptidyl-prolyl cis-trans isomerase C
MNVKRLVILAAAAATVAVAGCNKQNAGSAAGGESKAGPVATVNGTPISREFFDSYVKAIAGGKAPSELTAEQREQALDNLVRARVIGDQATKDGTAKDSDIATKLELARLSVLQEAAFEKYLKDKKPTDAEVRAEYDAQVAAMPKTEYHARHVLVATEAFAQKIVAELDKGGKFADIAKRDSMDSSKDSGGDLGWFTPDRMVKPFADAVAALKPGEYTKKPVQTQYGWHVIKLEETRPVAAPPFDQVKDRLVQIVQSKKIKAYSDELLKAAKIEKSKV